MRRPPRLPTRARPRRKLRPLALLRVFGAMAAFSLGAGGCAPTVYTLNVLPAERAVHQADEAGAPTHAPYEYYYARAHLEQAREDAGEAAYQDAIRNAKIAEAYGRKALELARRRLRERGR